MRRRKMIDDMKLSEIYDIEYTALIELRKKSPKAYNALYDALKLKELREILATEKTDTITKEPDQKAVPDIHDRRSAPR